MKIFMLTPYLPYPLHSGGQIRSYQLLKFLARRHNITLVSLIRDASEKRYLANLSPFCDRIIVVKRRKAWSPINILFSALSPYPFLIAIYYSLSLKHLIKKELERERYDLIHAETFYVMPDLPETNVPVLLVEQTIEFQVYKHFAQHFSWWLFKPLLYFDVAKLRFWEHHYWRKATRVVAMSQADKRVMQQAILSRDVDIVPNGVDLTFFQVRKRARERNPTILFVGNFNWLQNREAVVLLVSAVWPQICEKLPHARLRIVGRNPTSAIKKLSGDRITVETVADIRDAFTKSDVLVAPLYGPGGTRYKILEAMASGVPVVTTRVGIEGIEAQDGEDVLIRTTPRELADAVVAVIHDRALHARLVRNARARIEESYDWRKIAEKLDGIYREVGNAKTN